MSKGQYSCTLCGEDHHSGCVNLSCVVGYHNVKSTNPDETEGEVLDWAAQRAGSDEFERGRLEGRSELLKTLRECVKDSHENARGLARFGKDDAWSHDEARCRQWGALIVDSALECCFIADKMRSHNSDMDRFAASMREAKLLLREAEEKGFEGG